MKKLDYNLIVRLNSPPDDTMTQQNIINTLEQQLETAQTPRQKIDILAELAWELLEVDAQRAYDLSREAHGLIVLHYPDDESGLAKMHIIAAMYHHKNTHYGEAIQSTQQAYQLAEKVGDKEEMLRACVLFVNLYYEIGEYNEMIKWSLRQLDLSREVGNRPREAGAYLNLGAAYHIIGDITQAVDVYTKNISIYIELDNQQGVANSYMNIASAYRHLGQYADALEKGKVALEICKTLPIKISEAICLGILGRTYFDMGEYDHAMHHHQQKLVLVNQLDSDYMRAYTHGDIGAVYLKQGDLSQAIKWLTSGITIGEKTGVREALIDNYSLLVEAYKAQGDYQQALAYHERFVALREQMFNETSDRNRKMMLILHETQQAQLETKLQRQRAEDAESREAQQRRYFEELNTIKQQFIQSATHDLKNPLTSIRLQVSLIRRKTGDVVQKNLDIVEQQTIYMNQLITDMLEIAKLETGFALKFASTSLNMLIRNLVDEYDLIAQQKQIRLVLDDMASQVPMIISADAGYLHRALSNLVSNAIKYSPEQATVTIRHRQDEAMAVIDVMDTGFGIDENHLPHIFDRFYRVDNEQTQKIEGTGLGLAIVKTIIEQHRGTIGVESVLGKGTTFHVCLPLGV